MTPEDKIHRLQDLLERVKRNAKAPRVASAPVAASAPAPAAQIAAHKTMTSM